MQEKTGNRVDAAKLDALLRQTAEGNTDAFSELYQTTKTAVFGFCLSILHSRAEAEDVTHDCFVRVFTSASYYRESRNPMAWILTVARNLCLHRIRERGHDAPELWEPLYDESVAAEDRMVLAQILGALSEEERQIAVLHAVSGLKHREIAALLEKPLPTVLSKYNRAMKKLRILWQEER